MGAVSSADFIDTVNGPTGSGSPALSDKIIIIYKGWNFNSGNYSYLFTTDTK